MKNGQWEDWTEPLEVLFATAKEFLNTVRTISYRIRNLTDGGKLVVAPKLYTRKEELAKALAAFASDPKETWTTDFLENYVYVSSVYEDALDFVFMYIGENEHQMDLHGDEFAQTKADLLKDFHLYVESWTSPYWRSLE
jgi:hypothetical protein